MPNINKPSTIQGIAWVPGLKAIKESINFPSYEVLRENLLQNAPQNSIETRKKYTSLITMRLFPEHDIDGINPQVWRFYNDEKILEDLARVTTMEAEPVISKFYLDQIWVLTPGSEVDVSIVKDFIGSVYGSFKKDSYQRILQSMKHMGYVMQEKNKLIVLPIPRPDNAFLILLHARQALTPRIVRFSDIIGSTYWKFLGIREEITIRDILREGEINGLIAKYAVIDQLDQITTRFSFSEYLKSKKQL
jgi:hypothetical protein